MTNKLLFLLSLAIAITLACTVGHYAEAQTKRKKTILMQVIPVNLIVVRRPEITTQEQINLFLSALPRFREVKSQIKIVSIQEVDDVIGMNTYEDYVNRLFEWAKWSKKNKVRNQKVHAHFLLPPVTSNGVNYMGGVAGAICTTTRNLERKFSYSIMRIKNDKGLDRQEQSRTTAIHELLHNLGANHRDQNANIMHPSALAFSGVLPIQTATKRHVDNCRAGKGFYIDRYKVHESDLPFE